MSQQKTSEKNRKFSDTIKAIRLRRGLSQAEFARILGVTPAAVGNWESGANNPKLSRIKPIADKLNVSIDFLTGEAESMTLHEEPPEFRAAEPMSTEFLEHSLQAHVDSLPRAHRDQRHFILANIQIIAAELLRRQTKEEIPEEVSSNLSAALTEAADELAARIEGAKAGPHSPATGRSTSAESAPPSLPLRRAVSPKKEEEKKK